MLARFVAATAAVALAVGLTACQPEPQPSASGPVFASEEEAFAAAEETYRAYVDALNQVDLSDPETFEAVYAWTTGDANAGARESFSEMHADGWTVSGESVVGSSTPIEATVSTDAVVSIAVCLDVSAVTLVDSAGESVVAADRPDSQSVRVDLIESAISPTNLLISNLDGSDAITCS